MDRLQTIRIRYGVNARKGGRVTLADGKQGTITGAVLDPDRLLVLVDGEAAPRRLHPLKDRIAYPR